MLTSLELFLLHGIEFTLRPSVMIIFEYHNDSDSKRHISGGGDGGETLMEWIFSPSIKMGSRLSPSN